MKQILSFVIVIGFVLYDLNFAVAQNEPNVVPVKPSPSEETINLAECQHDADCIVVPYSHCCGSSKTAINRKHKAWYDAHPEAQKFNDPSVCAVIGMCASDHDVKKANCDHGSCRLVF